MAAEIIPFPQPEKQAWSGEISDISLSGRLTMIHESLHFYPHSSKEAGRIANLMGREEQQFPVLMHFNEVFIRQRKNKKDAFGAVRAIVHEFEDFAHNALNDRENTGFFLEYLEEAKMHPFSSFHTQFPTGTWEDDPTMRAALTPLTRYLETDWYARHPDDERSGARRQLEITGKESRSQRIDTMLGSLRVKDLKDLAVTVYNAESNRLDFWMTQLEEARRHLAVRQIATTALEELQGLAEART